MRKQIYSFAIMACLASSLAFAGDKTPSISTEAAQAAVSSDAQDQNGPCNSVQETKKARKKTNKQVKPAPTTQEEEFDRVLRGIYG